MNASRLASGRLLLAKPSWLAASALVAAFACGGRPTVQASSEGEDGVEGTGEEGTGTTSPTTTTGTDEGDSDAGSTSGADLPIPDDLPTGPCDAGKQDCPDGQKCTPYVETPGYCCVDSTKCVDVIGDQQYGDTCERADDNDDCAVGLFCMTKMSGGSGPGACLALCDFGVDASCVDKGILDGACSLGLQDVSGLCFDPCDPLAPDCAGDVLGCKRFEDQWHCVPLLEPAQYGEECSLNGCGAGLTCVGADVHSQCAADKCCTRLCDLSGDGDECVNGEVCLPYYGMQMPPPGYADVGLCGKP